MRAIQEIDTEKQEILVSYLNVMEKIEKRQEILARGYYFKCRCERCVFELKNETNSGDKSDILENVIVCRCKPIEEIKPIKEESKPTIAIEKAKDTKKIETKKVIKDVKTKDIKVVKDNIRLCKRDAAKNANQEAVTDKKEIKSNLNNLKPKATKLIEAKVDTGRKVETTKKVIDSKQPAKDLKLKIDNKSSIEKPKDATKKVEQAKPEINLEDKKEEEIKSTTQNKVIQQSKESKEIEDWRQVKKTRNQKSTKTNSKPTTPEPPKDEMEAKNEIVKTEPIDQLKKLEQIKIIETKVENTKIEADNSNLVKKEQQPAEQTKAEQTKAEQKLELPDKQQTIRQQTTDKQQTLRQNSKSPQPSKNRIQSKSPLQINRIRTQSKSPLPNRNQTKSPLPNKSRNQSKSPQPPKQQQKAKKEVVVARTPTPPPTRFVPYTEIERECLAKFDETNKEFTKKVEGRCWQEAFELSKQLYKCYLTYYRDDFSSEITLHLVQMLQIKRNILREQFNLENAEVVELLDQLKKNILVTHGVAHHLYKDFQDLCATIESTTKLA